MKELLIFLAGLGIGAGGTYVCLKNRFDEQLEEEVAELMDYRREKPKKAKKASKRARKASEEAVESEEEEFEPVEDPEVEEEDREAYSKIVKANYTKKSPEEMVKEKKKKRNDPKIFLLSPKAAASSEKEQKTVFLYGDGVVVDEESDEVIDNGYALLGGADVIREAENTGDTTVYIRNLNNDVDYEVVMCQEDYGNVETEEPGPEDG